MRFLNTVIQEESLCVYNMYNIVKEHFRISIAPVQNEGGWLVRN
jgi:hypothetical protein